MRISHEAIYQALYVQGRGALRRELTACLRTGRALRVPRARSRRRGKSFVTPEIMISERSAEAADRAVPGHWEGDLIIGLGRSAIGTLVERTTRFTMLLHLPRMEGHGTVPRVKNGPALAGHGAEAVRDAIARTITTLPAQLRRSLTWDQGAEMARHADLRIATGLPVYFCEPHSPWQRGTNENTNGLLRQYFPKGTDLSAHSPDVLAVVADALNTRPRKTLGWRTPAEALDQCLQASQTERVATTGWTRKDVLYRTQTMTWGCDTRHYPTLQAMQAEFQDCLAAGQTRVLKQDRGSSGDGVWKVELAGTVIQSAGTISPDAPVRVRHAKRGSVEEQMLLDQFMLRCEPYFEGRGGMIDQLYQSRLTDGMVRCYMVRDRVAGFGEQLINALYPAAVGADPETAPEPRPRLYYPPTRADFQPLKDRMEGEWLPNLCQMLELDPAKLPIIWDADFLYGPKDGAGADTYVLCKINVSSVYPIPDDALAPLAAATLAQLEARH